MDLTDTQQAILALIAERIDADGVPPSQTEIARAFGFRAYARRNITWKRWSMRVRSGASQARRAGYGWPGRVRRHARLL